MTSEFLTNAAQQRVGQVLRGKWRLDGLLGIGGMAAVYAATHRNGNRVAIKILHPQIAMDRSVQERFLREGYVANSVGHDGAVSVLDDDVTEDGGVFLVMEFLEGETLDVRAARSGGRLPAREVIALTEQLLDVLVAAHAKGIVHRDIKPENLILTTKGELKVLDFGIARLLERVGSTSATKTGSMLGTPAFMPPEQALGYVKDVDQQSDIWAVGAVMFSLLSGKTVHSGTTTNELLIAAATKPVSSISNVLPDLPPIFALIIDRALAFEKKARWGDAAVMLDAIREAMEVTVVDASAGAPVTVGTTVAASRTVQLVSQPEIERSAPSGSGIAAMPRPSPTTASSMAVGRTVANGAPKKPQHGTMLLVAIGAGGVFTMAALAAGIGIMLVGGPDDVAAPIPSAAVAASTVATAVKPEESPPDRDPATVDLSDLPVVSPARLDIVAEGGSCKVTLDKAAKGTTPITDLEVPPGEHVVHCNASGGKAMREKLTVQPGGTRRVVFKLRPSPAVPAPTRAAPPAATTVNPLDMR